MSKEGLPPIGSEVIGGYFYKDTWLKGDPEVFAWGQCRVIEDKHPDFPGVSAKQFLKSKGLQFDEAILNTPEHLDAFARMHPETKGMPQIFIQGQRVGGFAKLQAALRQLGL